VSGWRGWKPRRVGLIARMNHEVKVRRRTTGAAITATGPTAAGRAWHESSTYSALQCGSRSNRRRPTAMTTCDDQSDGFGWTTKCSSAALAFARQASASRDMLRHMRHLLVVAFMCMTFSGCVIAESGERPIYVPGPPVPGPSEAAPPPNIPKGHYPPPGSCRVWFPDRPPGQQPPPGPCERLQYQVPPGAYLIRG
jgi:hypothetical protein